MSILAYFGILSLISYFAEKDNVEATHIYSLIEFKKKDDKKADA